MRIECKLIYVWIKIDFECLITKMDINTYMKLDFIYILYNYLKGQCL